MNTSTLLLAAQLVKAPLGRKFASLAAFTIICTVNAGTINVTNTNDNLAGSLRQAIQDAAPGDTIVFGIPTSDPGYNATIKTWTISLTSAELIIGKNLTIAAGAKKIVVARSSAIGFRIFNVTGGTVTLANLTIANGSGFTGGGILNAGLLTVAGCTFYNNFASDGGAMFNSGTATIINCTFNRNDYAAIENASGGSVTMRASTVSGNGGPAPGAGGIYNNAGGTFRVGNSIIAGNEGSFLDATGSYISDGYNFIGEGDASSGFGNSGSHDQVGTIVNPANPNLSGLQDNGGPTSTMAPLAGSLVIDQGKSFGTPLDQRGFVRSFNIPVIANATGGDATDIGAVEFGAFPAPRADFNRDGFTDFVLFNPSTLRSAIWYLRGNALFAGVAGKTLPAGWSVVGVTDLDQNGAPDYLLFHASTRRTAVWFFNNATYLGSSFGPTLPSGWRLVAAVDINLDGKPDYVLFNPTTRRSAVWFLNGATFAGAAYGPTLPAGWTLIDALDFNANNKPDYLLFNPGTRQSAIWYLNGTAFAGAAFGPTSPAGWTLQGASEFNANGKPDYVLFEPSTRRTAIWYLNGTTFAGGAFGPTVASGYILTAP